MRAHEFIKEEKVQEIAPIIGALGGALVRGVGGALVRKAGGALAQVAKTGLNKLTTGAVNLGKQAVASMIKPTSGSSTPTITNTATNSTSAPLMPNPADLSKLKGTSIPTDLGQIKIGNLGPHGLDLEISPGSKLSQILGNQVTVPTKK